MFPGDQFEIQFFDLTGRMFYKQLLSGNITLISTIGMNKKGFSIAAVKNVKTGRKLAVKKIIIE